MHGILKTLSGISRRFGRGESGQVLLMFAAGLVGLCGLVGLSIDIGKLVYTATDVQKIADAAALAGSRDLPSTTTATSTAYSYRDQNGDATLGVTFEESNTIIRVSASRHVDFTFLKVLGFSGQTVTKSAAARGEPIEVTGYRLDKTAPFVLWGGTRKQDKPTGSDGCPLHMCVGKEYTFYSPNWNNANGQPNLPDWTNVENNFKGSISHGDGSAINHIGETLSVGGAGSPPLPAVGDVIVIPVVDKAGGNANEYNFKIAAWVQLEVTSCSLTVCSGVLLDPDTTPPQTGWVGGGSVQSPPSLTYIGRESGLVE